MSLGEIGKYFHMKSYSKVHFEDDGIFVEQRLPSLPLLRAAAGWGFRWQERIDDAVGVSLGWNRGQQHVAHED